MLMKFIEKLASKRVPEVSIEEIRREVKRNHDRLGAETAKRFTRGNTSIQFGAFLTREDLKRRAQERLDEADRSGA